MWKILILLERILINPSTWEATYLDAVPICTVLSCFQLIVCLPGWLCLCRLPTLRGSSCQKLHCTLSTRSLSTFTVPVLHQDRTEIYFPVTGGEPWGFGCFETRLHCVAGSGNLSALVLGVGKKLGYTLGLEVCTTIPWGEATLCFEEVKYLLKAS